MNLPKNDSPMPKTGMSSAAEIYAARKPTPIPLSQDRIDQCALSMEYVMDAAESDLSQPWKIRAERILKQSRGFDGPPPVRCPSCEG